MNASNPNVDSAFRSAAPGDPGLNVLWNGAAAIARHHGIPVQAVLIHGLSAASALAWTSVGDEPEGPAVLPLLIRTPGPPPDSIASEWRALERLTARPIKPVPPKFQVWVDARKRFHLSHAHVQMARELGMNPKKLGRIANHDQQAWKVPLKRFIEELYFKRFGKDGPEIVLSIEEMLGGKQKKKMEREVPREDGIADPEPDEDSQCPI